MGTKKRKPKLFKRLNAVRFLKLMVIWMVASVTIFTITMIVCYFMMGGVPDTLITSFYGWFGFQGGFTTLIQVADKIWKKKEIKKDEEIGLDQEAGEP